MKSGSVEGMAGTTSVVALPADNVGVVRASSGLVSVNDVEVLKDESVINELAVKNWNWESMVSDRLDVAVSIMVTVGETEVSVSVGKALVGSRTGGVLLDDDDEVELGGVEVSGSVGVPEGVPVDVSVSVGLPVGDSDGPPVDVPGSLLPDEDEDSVADGSGRSVGRLIVGREIVGRVGSTIIGVSVELLVSTGVVVPGSVGVVGFAVGVL